MKNPEDKRLYRIIAQSETITMTANTGVEMTEKEAALVAKEELLAPHGNYRNFILLPVGTAHGWKHGHINFCPRCGSNISDEIGDSSEMANNHQEFECSECEAYMNVHIISTQEENEDDSEDESDE